MVDKLEWCGCDSAPPKARVQFATVCAEGIAERLKHSKRVRVLSLLTGQMKQDATMLKMICSFKHKFSARRAVHLTVVDLIYAKEPEMARRLEILLKEHLAGQTCVHFKFTFLGSLADVKACTYDMVALVDPGVAFRYFIPAPPAQAPNVKECEAGEAFWRMPGDPHIWHYNATGMRNALPPAKKCKDTESLPLTLLNMMYRCARRNTTLHILDRRRTYHGPALPALQMIELGIIWSSSGHFHAKQK